MTKPEGFSAKAKPFLRSSKTAIELELLLPQPLLEHNAYILLRLTSRCHTEDSLLPAVLAICGHSGLLASEGVSVFALKDVLFCEKC